MGYAASAHKKQICISAHARCPILPADRRRDDGGTGYVRGAEGHAACLTQCSERTILRFEYALQSTRVGCRLV